jgi:acyl-CoA synthetase (AMP-forming)/AMP-acid ligase II
MGITQSIKRLEQQNPHGCATVFGTRTRRWDEFVQRVARLASGLRSLGAARGDRVALLGPNSDRYLEFYAGVPWADAVVVPLNTRWSAPENIYALNDSGAHVLLIDEEFVPMASAITGEARSVREVICMGEARVPAGMISYEHLIERSAPIPDAARTGGDLAGIFYTGGTTGFPKGVMLTHGSLWASAAAGATLVPMAPDTATLHAAPMFHLAGFGGVMMALLTGARHVIIPRFDPGLVLESIERHKVATVLLVPTMIRMLMMHPNLPTTNLSSLRHLIYGASPMPEALLREAMRALPGCRFYQAYGQTELSPVATILGHEYHTFEGSNAGKLASAGRVSPCCEVQVVDPGGSEVPRGTVGEIRVRGLNSMLGYWNKPEETAATLRDGWVHTGDAGWMDNEGFLYVVDRVKDMIISGGENVYTAEVENACVGHPAVSQCAVIGIPDDDWGEAVHAIVILKDGQQVTAGDLTAHCHRLIASYKCPRSIEFRTEPFPLSGVGKVLKRELRKPYWEGRDRQIH